MILLSAVNSSMAIKKKERCVIPIVMIQIIMIRLHQTNPKLPSLHILLLFPFKARYKRVYPKHQYSNINIIQLWPIKALSSLAPSPAMANTARNKSPTFSSTSRKYSASYSESSSHSQDWPASRDWSPMLWQARWWALCTCSSFWEQMRRWWRLKTCLRIISWTDSSHFCWAGSSRIISSTIDHSASLLYT